MNKIMFAALFIATLMTSCKGKKIITERIETTKVVPQVVIDPPMLEVGGTYDINLIGSEVVRLSDTTNQVSVTLTPVGFNATTGKADKVKVEATSDPRPVVKDCPPCESTIEYRTETKRVQVWPWWLWVAVIVAALSVLYNIYARFSLLPKLKIQARGGSSV